MSKSINIRELPPLTTRASGTTIHHRAAASADATETNREIISLAKFSGDSVHLPQRRRAFRFEANEGAQLGRSFSFRRGSGAKSAFVKTAGRNPGVVADCTESLIIISGGLRAISIQQLQRATARLRILLYRLLCERGTKRRRSGQPVGDDDAEWRTSPTRTAVRARDLSSCCRPFRPPRSSPTDDNYYRAARSWFKGAGTNKVEDTRSIRHNYSDEKYSVRMRRQGYHT